MTCRPSRLRRKDVVVLKSAQRGSRLWKAKSIASFQASDAHSLQKEIALGCLSSFLTLIVRDVFRLAR